MGRADIGIKCVQVRSLIEKRAYDEALEVVESIDIDRVTSILDLKVIASVYERLGMYEDAKQVLLRSYDKKPTKMVVYRLAYLCLKNKEFDDAEFFYQEFCSMAPDSPDRYILRYGIDREKGVDYYLRIATLQKLKAVDYSEEWGYELAKIYHKAGLYDDCVRECHDLMVWFGEGVIVEKARMLYSYHVEGKESLDAYGVFDSDLSPEEAQYRKEQYLMGSSDYQGQVEEVLYQEQQYNIKKQLHQDLEKTVDLRQYMDIQSDDQDLLKKEIHRSWGEPVNNGYEEVQQIERLRMAAKQHRLGKNAAIAGDMQEVIPENIQGNPEETEQMLAAGVTEVLEETGAIYEESLEETGEFYEEGFEENDEFYGEGLEENGELYGEEQDESGEFYEEELEETVEVYEEGQDENGEFYEEELEETVEVYEEGQEENGEFYEEELEETVEVYEEGQDENGEFYGEEFEEPDEFYEETIEEVVEEAMDEAAGILEEVTDEACENVEENTEETAEDAEKNQFLQEYGMVLWEYFGEYQDNIPLCEAVYDALEKAKNGKRPVNFLITCKDRERAVQMGRDLANAMCDLGITEKPQLARIDAEKLNGMHLEQNYEKLMGGSLLVEGAKHMTADTCQSIMNMIEEVQDKVVVMLTDARPYMCDLMDEYSVMKRYFPYDLNMK